MNQPYLQTTSTSGQGQPLQPYVHQNDLENPKDSPQFIRFSPVHQNIFAVGSWDQTLRLYEINQQFNNLSQKASISLPHYPLSLDFKADGSGLFVSCGDMSIYQIDFATMTPQKVFSGNCQILFLWVFGQQNLMLTINEANLLSLSYLNNPSSSIYSLQLNYSATCLDVSDNVVLIGFSENKFTFIDMNTINLYGPNDVMYNESQLKSPLSAVAVNAGSKEFALGSCDGRVYKGIYSQNNQNTGFGQVNKVIYGSFHNTNDATGNFVYIAHSKKRNDNTSDLFNISGLGFNKRSRNFLFSVGSDGVLNYWDIKEKNKIVFYNLGAPIISATINSTGTYVAFGIGYDWSQGVWNLNQINYTPKIGFRPVGDNELVFRQSGQPNTFNQPSLQLPPSNF